MHHSRSLCRGTSFLCSAALLFSGFAAPMVALAQDVNPVTALSCGDASVTDSYESTKEAAGEGSVGGPMDCRQAEAIARALNEADGCCQQAFAQDIKKQAEQRARSECSEKAGENFACDIYETDDTICVEGCGITVTPSNDPNGCTTDADATTCEGSARAMAVGTYGEQCAIVCQVNATSKAQGDFDVSCSDCTAESNCTGAAEAEVKKKERIAELEAKKKELEAQLAALDPQDPNYAQIAGDLIRDILSIVGELNKLYSFFKNLKKLFGLGKVPEECSKQF